MSPELEAVLFAEDLDELLRAREKVGILDVQDAEIVRSVLQQWQNAQAVSNLLFHPMLIPDEIRRGCLLRALHQHDVSYYVLAAVVGLQSFDGASLAPADRTEIVGELLGIIGRTTGILSQRASISIRRFLVEDDAPRIFALWAHPDDAVWNNLKAWLFQTLRVKGVASFAGAGKQSGLAKDVQQRLVEDFTEWMSLPAEVRDRQFPFLFGYIPNFREFDNRG